MNAVIYCRVSSKDQVDGTSLESQDLACRDYAKRQKLTVSKVFVEEGESAKFADRTQLLELLSYCKDKSHKVDFLIVWKLDRFARNVEDHYTIKSALKKLGVQIASVTEPIQDDPNGKLMETILAGFAQFDNDIRALRSVQGMQQRLREGIWPWKPPLGYLPPKNGKKTQPDTPDPRCFDPIRKAWQMFATGAYAKADILRLLRTWGVNAYRGRLVTAQLLDHMFANPYYAGVVRDPWSGAEHAGRHLPMVTASEFARVQEIVSGRNNSQPHHRLTDAFPLRGQVKCPSCEGLMTGYFAQGRCQRYPYYKCFRRGCPTRTKSYAAASVHDEFSQFLAEVSVPHYLATAIVTQLVSAYWEQTDEIRQATARGKAEAERLNRQLQELISMRAARLVADDEFIAQRQQLRRKLFEIQANRLNNFDESLTESEIGELAKVVSDLNATWWTVPVEAKRGFGNLLLPCGYVFQQVRTAETGLLFKTFGTYDGHKSDVVPLIKENLNVLIVDIRRLLALIRPVEAPKKEAA